MRLLSNCILFSIFFLNIFIIQGQDSYVFSKPMPPLQQNINVVSSDFFGIYQQDSSNLVYILNDKGISSVVTVYSSISRATVRESSKYRVSNGFLHGIVANDSVPCILEDETYYFGVKDTVVIIGTSSKNQLFTLASDSYIINFEDATYFLPSKVSFIGNQMKIEHFDYAEQSNIFSKIKEKKIVENGSLKTYILAPDLKEWNQILKKGIFGASLVFQKM